MHGSNSGPRLYNRIIKRNICLQNHNFYKFKTEFYKLLQKSLFETQYKNILIVTYISTEQQTENQLYSFGNFLIFFSLLNFIYIVFVLIFVSALYCICIILYIVYCICDIILYCIFVCNCIIY